MHLLCSLVVAVMALFPGSAGEGGLNLRAWMESYEKYLFEQMEENFKREKAETVTFEPKNAVSQQNMEVKVEQTTSQEIQTEAPDTGSDHVDAPDQSIDGGNERVAESVAEDPGPGLPGTGTPVAAEVKSPGPVYPLFSVNGAVLDIGVQEYLYQRLCEANIGWFYQYAILIAYQESRFDPLAVNPNGKDFGLFQFRLQYHPDLDWSNPYAQVDRFVLMMANRANNGKTAAEMISAHNQSDYGPYCQEYVSIVMSHEAAMVQIR